MSSALSILTNKSKWYPPPFLSLCSFLLTMTAVICWSIKMRIVARRANTGARKTSTHLSQNNYITRKLPAKRYRLAPHHGFVSRWSATMRACAMNHFLSS